MSRRRAALAGLVLALAAGAAQAQVAGSVTLASDYRLRGFSLTDRRPALSVSAAYDAASGLYAGGTVIAEDAEGRGVRVLGHMEYAGYAWRSGGRSFDVGLNNVELRLARSRIIEIDYTEVYAGVAVDNLSARLAVAPNYPRHGMETFYLNVAGVWRPAEQWRVSAAAGATARTGDYPGFDDRRRLYDVRLGVTRAFERGELSLSGVAVLPSALGRTSRAGLVLGATVFF